MEFPKLIVIPIIAAFITQLIKFSIRAYRRELSWSVVMEYGGMPSAHTAFVVSLTTAIGRDVGIASAQFAVAAVFSLITIRDAIGLRQFLSAHGRVLNMLIKDLPDDIEKKYPQKLVERFGHTAGQAFVGGLIGLVSALVLYAWLPERWGG